MASYQCGILDLRRIDLLYLILPPVVQAVVYGVYATLFCRCIGIYRKRRFAQGHKVILTGTVLLFFFCSIQCILGSFPDSIPAIAIAYNTIYVVANLIADSMFAYRCYVIWGRKLLIFWVPLCPILAEAVLGGLSTAGGPRFGEASLISRDMGQRAPLYITLGTNILFTVMSAGRIWWVSRELKVLGPKASQKYNTAIALIVESGAMYCVFIAAYVASIPTEPLKGGDRLSLQDTPSSTLFGLLNQIVGIVPTLMVVRVGLGVSTEDAQTAILASGIRFDHGEESSSSGRIGTNNQMTVYSNGETHTVMEDSAV